MTNALEDASQVARTNMYLYSAMLLPAFSKVVIRDASTKAQMELAQLAMALQRFHNAHAQWPEDLQALTPQFLDFVPVDPFDGTPLSYRLLNKGCVIYSVDADGHDDGGRESPDHKKSTDTNSYDITFTVER